MAGAVTCLLFDLDGTICDSKPGIERCIRHALRALGRPLDPGLDLDWCVGPPLDRSLAELLGPGDRGLLRRAVELYRELYRSEGIYESSLYPGVGEALAGLGLRCGLLLVTSKPRPFADELLRHFGLAARFRGVYASGLDGSLGDKGDLVAAALAGEGLGPDQALMVGDRGQDMAGARRNGVAGLGALWGYGAKDELLAAGAAALVERPADLADALRDWLAGAG